MLHLWKQEGGNCRISFMAISKAWQETGDTLSYGVRLSRFVARQLFFSLNHNILTIFQSFFFFSLSISKPPGGKINFPASWVTKNTHKMRSRKCLSTFLLPQILFLIKWLQWSSYPFSKTRKMSKRIHQLASSNKSAG